MPNYDIIVIGAGHAGIEASLACARLSCKTLLITLNSETIGLMSCNPAIGGVGKGQLVKEIDALGGEMARAADSCAIQFRMLNASKGAAVQSSRAQIDMYKYNQYMRGLVTNTENLFVKEAQVTKLKVDGNLVKGVITDKQEELYATCVIISPGTFLDGVIHIGLKNHSAGRINEPASCGLGENLAKLGFKLLRFKTGTCPRLDARSIDFSKLIIQNGDNPPRQFSFFAPLPSQKQVPCHITYTNTNTHEIIRKNLDRSPLYAGIIKATGVRYCPSIEDKIVKFSDKERHQVFLEPEGLDTFRIYPNGLSTSLPEDVQLEMLHSIEGLEKVRVVRFGYGIEHTVVEPTQLNPTLETKPIKNLYLAGQINGTTGYEEAAAQGLIAGINAALRVKNKEPLVLKRSNSYIGVLLDDLTTKGTLEPYRMFTSRVEYRLILREDNADLRLTRIGYDIGLINESMLKKVEEKKEAIKKGRAILKSTRLKPREELKITKVTTIEQFLKRPQVRLKDLLTLAHVLVDIPEFALSQIEIEVKYSGFIERQLKEVERFDNVEKIKIPQGLDYKNIPGLSREIKEKLQEFLPLNLGQAARISGVTPAAISILMVYLKKVIGFRSQVKSKEIVIPEESGIQA